MKTVIVTGGSGYIGSTISAMLLESGYKVINIDIASPKEYFSDKSNYMYVNMDISESKNEDFIKGIYLSRNKGDQMYALIHMAAWKDLPGSYDNPYEYYRNNIQSTINALFLAQIAGCKRVIFSSSAGVYPDSCTGAVPETQEVSGDSPYGYTKVVGERIVKDLCIQYGMIGFNLRYCNPIGTYKGISVDRSDSMFGNIINALDNSTEFTIFGNDYDSPDGTCIRDYIDLRDVAAAHIHFLTCDLLSESQLVDTVNLGTGIGVSCLQVCQIVKNLYPMFKYTVGPRRQGDAVGSYADITKLKSYGFKCKYTLAESIKNIIHY